MEDDLMAKWLAVAVLGLGAMAVGLLPPILVARCGGHRTTSSFWRSCLSCLLCTGAGLLLGTALVHMTREARTKLTDFELTFPGTTETLLGFGFLLVYFTEEMVHLALHGTSRGHSRRDSGRPSITETEAPFRPRGDGPPCYGSLEVCMPPLNEYRQRETENLIGSVPRGEEVVAPGGGRPLQSPTAPSDHDPEAAISSSPLPTTMLLLALSLHSSIEGLAIGIESTAKGVLFMLIMVAVHKFAIAFYLGAETVLFVGPSEGRQETPASVGKAAIFLAIFSLSSAVGIFAGAMVGHSGLEAERSEVVGAFLQAIASGALVYVSLIEIIPRERARCHSIGLFQFIGVTLGFATPVGLNFISY
ncbi:zinc transporter ZIP2-like [Hetaerina americana]|uniref:zinc transporter ZIP2-like n=1 Tax=Hetaerina americana TaxID=62018 RepID=UPI003A7F5F28